MRPLLYGELTSWYHLIDPVEDHEDEAAALREAIERTASLAPETLLELGAGAGNNAFYLRQHYRCTLTDRSAEMLALSRARNPGCEHVQGDMRSLRLGRLFDAVLIHDAIVYMTTAADLLAAARTAFVHLRPGGAAVFAPDVTRERFREKSEAMARDAGGRSLRGIEWTWDPDPGDSTYDVDFALLLREGSDMRAVHDRHRCGLFDAATWRRVLAEAGFEVGTFVRPIDDEGSFDEIFVCRRR